MSWFSEVLLTYCTERGCCSEPLGPRQRFLSTVSEKVWYLRDYFGGKKVASQASCPVYPDVSPINRTGPRPVLWPLQNLRTQLVAHNTCFTLNTSCISTSTIPRMVFPEPRPLRVPCAWSSATLLMRLGEVFPVVSVLWRFHGRHPPALQTHLHTFPGSPSCLGYITWLP